MTEINIGETYPGWTQPFEGSIFGTTAEGLHLLMSMPYPREIDIEDFQNLKKYGIYTETYPLIIWQFGDNFLLATPCNPAFERQQRPEEAWNEFLTGEHTAFTRFLIDQRGIIRVLGRESLDKSFIQALITAWSEPETNWEEYNDWVHQTFRTPTHRLWEKARQFPQVNRL